MPKSLRPSPNPSQPISSERALFPLPHLGLGLLLTACAGFVDAVGFVQLGGLYTSFMSGNTTQMGAALADGTWGLAVLPLVLVAMFFLGSFLGSACSLRQSRGGLVATYLLVIATLVAAIALHIIPDATAPQSMAVLALGMGAQNALVAPVGAVRLGATFITGTLFAAGNDLARALARTAPPWRWLQHLLVWLCLLVGALVGAVAFSQAGVYALVGPGAVYLVFMIAALVSRRRPGAA
jgi:uncharacterized membrane protein YoaK (UPF0700 family)